MHYFYILKNAKKMNVVISYSDEACYLRRATTSTSSDLTQQRLISSRSASSQTHIPCGPTRLGSPHTDPRASEGSGRTPWLPTRSSRLCCRVSVSLRRPRSAPDPHVPLPPSAGGRRARPSGTDRQMTAAAASSGHRGSDGAAASWCGAGTDKTAR